MIPTGSSAAPLTDANPGTDVSPLTDAKSDFVFAPLTDDDFLPLTREEEARIKALFT